MIESTQNIANIVLIFRICGVKVSKIQVEREGGLGGWWVIPSKPKLGLVNGLSRARNAGSHDVRGTVVRTAKAVQTDI
jgi:hypothetical protein